MLALSFILLFQPLLLPAKVHAAAPTFVSVSQNVNFGYALDSNGHIWAWGNNSFGAYGDGTTITVDDAKRVEVMDSGSPVTFQDVKAGVEHGLALDTDGRIWTTGRDNNLQLGNGSSLGNVQAWTKISAVDGGSEAVFEQIAPMRFASYALDENGKLWVFGNFTRVLSEGSEVPIPATRGGIDAETFQQIDGEFDFLLGIDTAGNLWGIDRNSYLDPFKYTATDSGGTDVLFQSVSSGIDRMNTALDEDGQVWIWGDYEAGQLGDGGATNAIRYDPELLPITDSDGPVVIADIAAGNTHVLALDDHGDLWAWGNNDNGKLGNGSTVDSNVPIQVTVTDADGNPVRFTSVEAGDGRSYGIDTEGRIWTWGGGTLVPELQKFTVSVDLTVSPASSSSYLQLVTLTATVSGDGDSPTGTVVFKDGSTILGSSSLSGGTAAWTTSSLSVATHSLTAEYSGDEFYAAETSATVSHQVMMPDAPDLTLTPSPTIDTFDPVTVSVSVDINGSGNSLDRLKWLAGNQNASAFSASGTDITVAREFDATDNGIYTIYARDAAGNETVKTIEIDNILEAGDASALNTAITNANQSLTDHGEGSGVGEAPASARNTLQTAINAAQTVYDDRTNQTQTQLNTATSTLETAITAFEAAVIGAGDATALNTAITDANAALTDHPEGTSVGEAPASARSTLQAAIGTAQTVYDDRTNRTQTQLNTATSTLETAITAFEAAVIGAGDATALNTAITDANEALTDHPEGTGVGEAPASARSTLQSAIAVAQTVYNDRANQSQTELDHATNTLNDAIAAFKASVTGIALTTSSDGLYGAGETLAFKVTYGYGVTVSGTPEIPLEIGSGTVTQVVYAAYSGDQETEITELSFQYETPQGLVDVDGIAILSPIVLPDGASIMRTSGGAADLAYELPDTNGVRIVSVPPDLALSSSPDNSAPTRQAVDITVTASVYGELASNTLTELSWMDGSRSVAEFNGGTGNDILGAQQFDVSANGTYSVYAKDAAGNEAVIEITITNIVTTTGNNGNGGADESEDESKDDRFIITLTADGAMTRTYRLTTEELGASDIEIDGNLLVLSDNPQEWELKLPATMLLTWMETNPEGRLILRTELVDYELPAAALTSLQEETLDAILLRLSRVSTDTLADLEKAVEGIGAQLHGEPVMIGLFTVIDGQEQKVAAYEQYISVTQNFGTEVQPNNRLVARYNPEDITFSPVPATVDPETVHWSSRSGGIYAVLSNDKIFADARDTWFEEAVNLLGSKLIVQGVDETNYAPNELVTRAELVAMLIRALGLEPVSDGANVFTDVSSYAWYAEAVNTATKEGLVHGYENGSFRPDEQISREETAAILMNAMRYIGMTFTDADPADLSGFVDAAQVSDWAVDEMAVAVQSGILLGDDTQSLHPHNAITRAEVAVMLERMLRIVNFID